jgi:hypothetical protein
LALIFAASAKHQREAGRIPVPRKLFWRGCRKAAHTGGLRPLTALKALAATAVGMVYFLICGDPRDLRLFFSTDGFLVNQREKNKSFNR